ncbi:MAG: ROK family glucokinase, partial [Lachnospiraceae bacterium]|nr:ROK family glucokinase [Lachnospiraceae bacterium]
MKYVFGIDIGGTTVKMGLFTVEGEMVEKWEIPTRCENGGEAVPADITEAIHKKMAEKKLTKEDVLGVGVGVPGPVKSDGTVLKCANLGWGIMNVNKVLGDMVGLPVYAANDANVAALGEMWKGGGQGYKDMVMITLGTGVGGGIIVNGSVVAGSNGAGGEIGHMVVNPDETRICGCGGHGHLEQYTSATGIAYLATEAVKNSDKKSELSKFEKITAKDVFDCAKAGDELADEIVNKVCKILAGALKCIVASVDPEAFVIGGGVSKAGTIITDLVRKYYEDNLLNAFQGKEFKLATLGNDAGMYGSAKL